MIRRLTLLATCALAFALIASVSPAGATTFTYKRNGTLINGQIRGECGATCYTSWYRAGSGNGYDACQTNNWVPLGTYTVPWHNHNYNASLIKGRVWRMSDYQCQNGVRRTELFVHSEETADNGQYCTAGDPDDDFCWEGDQDYYSFGCIKVARMPVTNGQSDLGRIDSYQHSYNVQYVGVIA
jgi:hypothetical protein